MASDVMRVRLHLREIRVLAVALDTPSELRVEVESTVRRPRCPACGFGCVRVHDTRRRKVRDLEVSGRRTTLVWMRRRFVCDNCSTRHLEDHREFENKLTRRLSRRLVADARVMTLRAAARRHGLGWHLINGVVKAWSAALAEHRRSRRCAVLLVDETSMRKRHRYVTVIVNGDTGKTLAMVQHRSSAALSTFLMQQGHRWCKGVKVVVSDGSKAYKSAIDAHLGHARHVLDRFHVIRWFSAGLTQVRATSSAALKAPARLRPRSVPGPVRAAAQRRPAQRSRPSPPRPVRRPPPPQSRLAGPPRAPRPLPRRRPPRRPRRPRTVLRPLRDRRAARDDTTGGASRPGGSDPCPLCPSGATCCGPLRATSSDPGRFSAGLTAVRRDMPARRRGYEVQGRLRSHPRRGLRRAPTVRAAASPQRLRRSASSLTKARPSPPTRSTLSVTARLDRLRGLKTPRSVPGGAHPPPQKAATGAHSRDPPRAAPLCERANRRCWAPRRRRRGPPRLLVAAGALAAKRRSPRSAGPAPRHGPPPAQPRRQPPPSTIATTSAASYAARRRAEGKTRREIIRCLTTPHRRFCDTSTTEPKPSTPTPPASCAEYQRHPRS